MREDIINMARSVFDYNVGNYGHVTFSGDRRCIEDFAAQVAAHEREQCARLVKEMVEKNYDLDDFANSVRAGAMRLCSDGRPKWLKVSMEVAAEREACARVCDEVSEDLYMDSDAFEEVLRCAKAIRARGEK